MRQDDFDRLPIHQRKFQVNNVTWTAQILDCRMQAAARIIYDIKFTNENKEPRFLCLIIAAEALHVFDKQPEVISIAGNWLESTDEKNGTREYLQFT